MTEYDAKLLYNLMIPVRADTNYKEVMTHEFSSGSINSWSCSVSVDEIVLLLSCCRRC